MTAQAINLLVGISSRNISCVFTRELDKKPQQYSTNYLYKVSMVYAMTVHHPTLISMPCPHVHYSSTMLLPQGQYAMFIYPDIILLISVDYVCTMCTPWGTHVPWHYPNPRLFPDSSRCHKILWTPAIFILFFWLYRVFFFFFLLDDEEACDISVTWCDVISLEHGGKI